MYGLFLLKGMVLLLLRDEEIKEVVAKLRFCRFSGSFEPIFDSNCGGHIDFRILPPQFESKSGQNNPENRRTLNFATTSREK